MNRDGLPPRRAALQLVTGVLAEGRLMSELAPGLARLDPADRARAQRLAGDTLRWLERLDRVLKPFMERKPATEVRNALRLGALELCTGAAAHGVVNDWVEIIGASRRHGRARGFVNAVLRKVADQGPGRWDGLPIPRLPRWLRGPLTEAYGGKVVAAMERAHAAGAPLDLSARGDTQALAGLVGGTLLPTGSVRVAEAGQVSGLPGFADGAWWVQDAAAALPVRLLGDIAGLRVLDLCAAPGGKTLQLAAAGAQVTAVDASEARMARVTENLARTGLAAECRIADALDVTEDGWDAVLLDAPCSATGTIRRHPDLPHAKDGAEFGVLIDQQSRMIDHALTLLAPGGRLVFCTCSLLPDEGEVQIEAALERHPGLTVVPVDLPWVEPGWAAPEGGLRLRPDFWSDRGGMDGFYMACLAKPA